MNEKEISELMGNIDFDLIIKEIDELSGNIEIDMESISEKAHKKLKKESLKMRKKKRLIIAAALVAVLGTSAVYASEISDFVKSFLNKRQIYSTVVEGDAFYLENPVLLDEANKLENVIFTKSQLLLKLISDIQIDKISDLGVSILGDGKTYVPTGYALDGSTYLLSFYNETDESYTFSPTNGITVNIGDSSYYVDLSEGEPVTAKGEIYSAKQTPPEKTEGIGASAVNGDNDDFIIIDWINVGFKETDKGVQILTKFNDDEIKLVSIGEPTDKKVSYMNDHVNYVGSGTSSLTNKLLGYGKDGTVYEYDWDRNTLGRPVTVFQPDKPVNGEIELKIPSLIIEYGDISDKTDSFDIDIPGLNGEIAINREIDLKLQKMILKSIKRTSETTAELTFDLNTGEKKEAAIRDMRVWSDELKKTEGVWDGNSGTMNITFDEDLKSFKLSLYSPSFVVKGNWLLVLNGK